MKIENFRKEIVADRARITARLIWENCDRKCQDVYFETTAKFQDDLFPNPNSFLLASALPAMRYGEERIAIDAPICPEIKDGLYSAMKCLINWHGGDRKVIPIEAAIQSTVLFPKNQPRAGAFFSGGIDALAMLQDNRLNFSAEHPRHIKDGILVYGILQGENESDPNFKNVINAVSAIADDAGINLIQVSTNAYAHFRDLDPNFSFWRLEYLGSFLAAIAHAFAPRLTIASIASTYDYASLEPWGSHPLLDGLYSNFGLQIRHENAALSRLEKIKLIAKWDVALKNLRVCNEKSSYSQGNYNCGKCYKCLKTKTALLALGLLDRVDTFVEKDVSYELLVENCYLSDAYGENCYLELIQPLSQLGRDDLVDGIIKISRRYHEQDFSGQIKRLDRHLFGGNLLNIGKKIKTSFK
ncbi:MAG TPA: hypothetical protein V6C71_24350 [Coleofasciculaceae cyanobacterium]